MLSKTLAISRSLLLQASASSPRTLAPVFSPPLRTSDGILGYYSFGFCFSSFVLCINVLPVFRSGIFFLSIWSSYMNSDRSIACFFRRFLSISGIPVSFIFFLFAIHFLNRSWGSSRFSVEMSPWWWQIHTPLPGWYQLISSSSVNVWKILCIFYILCICVGLSWRF